MYLHPAGIFTHRLSNCGTDWSIGSIEGCNQWCGEEGTRWQSQKISSWQKWPHWSSYSKPHHISGWCTLVSSLRSKALYSAIILKSTIVQCVAVALSPMWLHGIKHSIVVIQVYLLFSASTVVLLLWTSNANSSCLVVIRYSTTW